jgi:DNA-binding LacI/PurR family transcriptional regulator
MSNRLRNDKNKDKSKVTILQVAQDLGLSKTTVSRAISGKGRVSAATREQVQQYIEKSGYRPNLIAKSLAVSKTFNIGVSLPSDAELNEIPFFQTCLYGITEAVNLRDYDVVVSVISGQDVTGLKRLVLNNKVDGFILTRLVENDSALLFLREMEIPFVLIGSSDDTSIPQVDSDHFSGCREITSHVLGLGLRRLTLLAGNPAHQVSKERYAGFAAALESAGLKPGADGVRWGLSDAKKLEEALPEIMKEKPDCLLCMDDVIASRALTWLHRHGYEIPKDVKVASFHDSAFMESHTPPVTALRINVTELGASAGNALVDALEGKELIERRRLGYEIQIRESTRP